MKNDKIKTEQEILKHFGQEDHLRVYSAEGLMDRLQSVGFNTSLKEYNTNGNNYGLNKNEKIIIAKKPI
jgi:hypothetical protein